MEGYLDIILNRTHRIRYTKIRISNHRFAVETGRFRKIPRDERLCLFCKKKQKNKLTNSVIEDEKHVLLHCPWYESLRKELYNSINERCPNIRDNGKFNYLLNSDGQIVKVVARFFHMASLTHSSVSIS